VSEKYISIIAHMNTMTYRVLLMVEKEKYKIIYMYGL
jgi:hypothetical protein